MPIWLTLPFIPEYRCQDIGHALLDAAKQWARERRLDYLELNVLAQNIPARPLYDREGFQQAASVLRCPL